MQVLHAQAVRRPGSRLGIATGLAIGILLLALGVALGYLAVATPFAERFIPEGRAGTLSTIGSALGWTLLLVAPALAGIAGIAWLAGVAERAAAFRARPHPVVGLSRVLGEEFAAATGLRLPDGRIVSEVIVGPHGIAVFEPLPPLALIRVHAGAWELRIGRDRWVPLENPLDRTVRSADRSPPLDRRRRPRLRGQGPCRRDRAGGVGDRPHAGLRRDHPRPGPGLPRLAARPAKLHCRPPRPGPRAPPRHGLTGRPSLHADPSDPLR